jgi:hypothetical protein
VNDGSKGYHASRGKDFLEIYGRHGGRPSKPFDLATHGADMFWRKHTLKNAPMINAGSPLATPKQVAKVAARLGAGGATGIHYAHRWGSLRLWSDSSEPDAARSGATFEALRKCTKKFIE